MPNRRRFASKGKRRGGSKAPPPPLPEGAVVKSFRYDPEVLARALSFDPEAVGELAATASPVPADGGLNAWERSYAAILERRRHAGEVLWYAFEPMRFRLSGAKGDDAKAGRDAYYTPDFGVVLADRQFELHEVKGFWQEAALVRIRVASTMYPFPFVAVRGTNARKALGGGIAWETTRYHQFRLPLIGAHP